MKLTKGQHLIHVPTGRPVKVASVTDDFFTVHTMDDTWPHPKTGKPWGGSSWIKSVDDMREFVSIEEYYREHFKRV